MYRNGLKKYYVLLVVLLLSLVGIGYAVLNTTLNINGKSSIRKNAWDIHFDNIQIKDGSVEATNLPTIENNIKVYFEVGLNLPGDFYEFTVDVVNSGTIDAMIESITKEPELSSDQQKYLNYIIEYQNGEQITNKQLVKVNSFVRLKVKVELRKDIDPSDLPDVGDVLYLSFTVNYQQADGTGVNVKDNGFDKVIPVSNGSLDEVGTIVTIGTEKFYTIGTDGDNVKLLSMMNITLDDEPIQRSNAGTTAFSNDSQKGINCSDYNGSILEGYVNNYNNYLIKQGVPLIEARLITKDELISLGCNESVGTCVYAPDWVYATDYWSGSSYDTAYVWYVLSFGPFAHITSYYDDNLLGVRPVIVIAKSEVKQPI